MRIWLLLAALNGAAAVGAGAYGWHFLEQEPEIRDIFMMGVDYHMWHALALLGVAWLADRRRSGRLISLAVAGWSFTAGIILFSGTLYAFTITGDILITGAAPIGGLALAGGWLALAWTAVSRD